MSALNDALLLAALALLAWQLTTPERPPAAKCERCQEDQADRQFGNMELCRACWRTVIARMAR